MTPPRDTTPLLRLPVNPLTGVETKIQIGWPAGLLACWLADLLACWPAGWLASRLVGQPASWLVDWLSYLGQVTQAKLPRLSYLAQHKLPRLSYLVGYF